jgi:hypothetical protein
MKPILSGLSKQSVWRERRGHYLQVAVTSIHRAVAFPCLRLRTEIGGLGQQL